MGIRLLRLVVLWLVASAEAFRVHGAAVHAAKGVQGGGGSSGAAAAGQKRGRPGKQIKGAPRDGAGNGVCEAGDSPETCLALAQKYRGGATAPGTEKLSLNMIKILLQVCLTTLNVVCWFVPMKIRRFVESERAISMANAFSGGVFLSLAFGHMIPHAHHGFMETSLPQNMPYFLVLGGYMLIFFVEKIAFDAHNIMHEGVVSGDGHNQGSKAASSDSSGSNSAVSSASGRSATILLVALGVHALMETMALGLSSTKLSAGLLATSIGLHQPAESLALLVSFLKSGLSEGQIIKMLSIFSCIGPVGLGIGIAIAEVAGQLADAIMVALAAGTFIYVGATEVIAEEFETPHDKWKKFSALTGGIVIIAFITHWAESLENMAQ